jgi:hypothetical protein
MNDSFASSRLTRLIGPILACALEISLTPLPASAQTASDRATARALAEEGFAALEARHFDIAQDRFRRADGLVHAPTFVVDEGRALIGLGRYVEAQERFQLVLREGVGDTAPTAWKSALKDAAKLLEEVEPKIAWLTISVANADDAEVKIDSLLVPRAAFNVRRASNPGTREIAATASGFAPQKLKVELKEGDERAVTLTFKQLQIADSPGPKSARVAVPRERVQNQRRSPTLAYVSLGVGGLGLAVGTVSGVLALRKRSELASICPSGACPPSTESDVNAYDVLGLVSGLGFGLGLAAATTGVLLLQTGGSANQPETAQLSVRLQMNPRLVGLEGIFQ